MPSVGPGTGPAASETAHPQPADQRRLGRDRARPRPAGGLRPPSERGQGCFCTGSKSRASNRSSTRPSCTSGEGITAVVGPNGCGKSNVSDAIRWVLGEQSAKQLRGDQMEDVIFNGSRRASRWAWPRSPSPSRTTAGILGDRVHRGHDHRAASTAPARASTCINKTPCRLKDIRDLFMDTGMGSHAYSVIEQGQIDQVLSRTTPRTAASCSRRPPGSRSTRSARRRPSRKLEATETDLVRLNDIVFEVERELRSLGRQVGQGPPLPAAGATRSATSTWC